MLCTVVDLFTKWATVLDGKLLGTSKHKDYSLFHFKARDVAALKQPITKFVFVSAKGDIDEVILADQLKTRGVNYKTAVREAAGLTDVELAEVSGAYELARVALSANPSPKLDAEPKPAAPHLPADGEPDLTNTSEATAAGIDEQLVHAASSLTAGTNEAADGQVADEAAAVEGSDSSPEGEDFAAGPPADDPLATVKPSRKKRRR